MAAGGGISRGKCPLPAPDAHQCGLPGPPPGGDEVLHESRVSRVRGARSQDTRWLPSASRRAGPSVSVRGPGSQCPAFVPAAPAAGEHVHQPRPREAAGHHLRVRRGQEDARVHREQLSAGAWTARAPECFLRLGPPGVLSSGGEVTQSSCAWPLPQFSDKLHLSPRQPPSRQTR